MSPSNKTIIALIGLCLVFATAQSAPTETEASSTTPMSPAESENTIGEQQNQKETTTTSTEASSMAVSSAQDQHVQNTSFTCYNKPVGYYADTQSHCKVYHFCMLGDYNGQEVYQRISYLCLNDTIFDQQALDCVESAKMLAPCADSAKYYDESNTILRKAIIGKVASVESDKSEATPSTTAPASGSESTTTGATEATSPSSTPATEVSSSTESVSSTTATA